MHLSSSLKQISFKPWNLMFCIFLPLCWLSSFLFLKNWIFFNRQYICIWFQFCIYYTLCILFFCCFCYLINNKFLQKKYSSNIVSIFTLQSLMDTAICSCIQFFFTCVAPSTLDKHWIELFNQLLLQIFQHIVDERYVN